MLEIKITTDKCCDIHMEGSTIELTAEVLALLNSLYNALHEDDEYAAEWFAQAVVREIVKPDSLIFKPYRKEDDE